MLINDRGQGNVSFQKKKKDYFCVNYPKSMANNWLKWNVVDNWKHFFDGELIEAKALINKFIEINLFKKERKHTEEIFNGTALHKYIYFLGMYY